MFTLELSDDDQEWLKQNYPDLNIAREDGIQVVSGEFSLYRDFKGEEIADTYQVRIELRNSPLSDLPTVFESGSRIKKISEERNVQLADLHAYEDGSACLCIKLAEASFFPNGFSFQTFITELVEPYYYAQSFFEKFNSWPWETYSHGIFGWLEWYLNQKETTPDTTNGFIEKMKSNKNWNLIRTELTNDSVIKGHQRCICGSGNRYRNCHKKVFRGIWKLQRDLNEFAILI